MADQPTQPTQPTPPISHEAVHSASNLSTSRASASPPPYLPHPTSPAPDSTTGRPPVYTPTSGWTIGSISDYRVAGRQQSIYDRLISQNIGRTISVGRNPQIVLQAQQMFLMRSSRPPAYTERSSQEHGEGPRPVEVGRSPQTRLLQWRDRPGGAPRYGRYSEGVSHQVGTQTQQSTETTRGNPVPLAVGVEEGQVGEGRAGEGVEIVGRE